MVWQRPGLIGKPGLSAVQCLDLAFFIEREHHGMGWGIDIEADDVGQLGGKARIARVFEGTDAVWLQLVGLPNALHRAQRNGCRLGHRTAGPMGTRAATRWAGSGSAEARTMRARSTCFRGRLRSPTIACNRSRSAALTITHTV